MYLNQLTEIFNRAIEKTELSQGELYNNRLRQEIEKRNYDTQDISLMEIMIKEEHEEFEKSFAELIENTVLNRIDRQEYIDSDECIKETVNLFIQSLEHSIDYYYNSIIARYFSST